MFHFKNDQKCSRLRFMLSPLQEGDIKNVNIFRNRLLVVKSNHVVTTIFRCCILTEKYWQKVGILWVPGNQQEVELSTYSSNITQTSVEAYLFVTRCIIKIAIVTSLNENVKTRQSDTDFDVCTMNLLKPYLKLAKSLL